MAMNDYVDAYCERVEPGFWAEPLNAASNAGFVIAGLLLLARLGRAPQPIPWPVRILPALLIMVGLGSLAFHTFATVWAGWLDTGFILAFACTFVYAFLRHLAGLGTRLSALAALIFFWISFGAKAWMPALGFNGSEAYLPMTLGLFAMTAWLWRRGPAFKSFLAASLLFCASLALRTVDHALCAHFPIGTHFGWHLMNAVVLYALTEALMRDARSEG